MNILNKKKQLEEARINAGGLKIQEAENQSEEPNRPGKEEGPGQLKVIHGDSQGEGGKGLDSGVEVRGINKEGKQNSQEVQGQGQEQAGQVGVGGKAGTFVDQKGRVVQETNNRGNTLNGKNIEEDWKEEPSDKSPYGKYRFSKGKVELSDNPEEQSDPLGPEQPKKGNFGKKKQITFEKGQRSFEEDDYEDDEVGRNKRYEMDYDGSSTKKRNGVNDSRNNTSNNREDGLYSSGYNKLRVNDGYMANSGSRGKFTNSKDNLKMFSRNNLEKLEERIARKKINALLGQKNDITRLKKGGLKDQGLGEKISRRERLAALNQLRKTLLKKQMITKTGKKLYRIVSKDMQVQERFTFEMLKQDFETLETEQSGPLNDDETFVFEIVEDRLSKSGKPILIKKKVKRAIITEMSERELLMGIEQDLSDMQQKDGMFDPVLARGNMKMSNLFDQMLEIEFMGEEGISKMKVNPRSGGSQRIFSRMNNNMTTQMKRVAELKRKIENFVLIWLRDNLEIDGDYIQGMIDDPEKRVYFFRNNSEVLDIILRTVLKKPKLYSRLKEVIYDKKRSEGLLGKNNHKAGGEERVGTAESSVTEASVNQEFTESQRELATVDPKIIQKNNLSILEKNFTILKKLDFRKPDMSEFERQKENEVIRHPGGQTERSTKKDFSLKRVTKQSFYNTIRSSSNNFLIGNPKNYTTQSGGSTKRNFFPKKTLPSPGQIDRTYLNTYGSKPHIDRIESIRNIGVKLGIKQPDLMWVAVLALFEMGSELRKIDASGTQLSYFSNVVKEQSSKRFTLELKTKKEVFSKIIEALSWIGFIDNTSKSRYFNFFTNKEARIIPESQVDLMFKFSSYV